MRYRRREADRGNAKRESGGAEAFDGNRRNDYLKLAAQLRAAGLGVELYPEPKKLGKQLQYADRQGFAAALILGDAEFTAGQCQVKNLASGESANVPYDGADAGALASEIRRLIQRSPAS